MLLIVLPPFPSLAQGAGQKPESPSPPAAAVTTSSSTADSTQLEIIKAPHPSYPLEAAEKRLQGQVWITLHISESGGVESTEIISGNPLLATATEQAVQKWKFKPFIRNGQPVKVTTSMPFDFAFKQNVFDTPGPSGSTQVALPSVPAVNATSPSDDNGAPQMVRVSQGVMEGALVHRVEPVYPPEAKQHHVQGDVLLNASVGKDGRIYNLTVISGPPELIEASVGAVQQWRYQPYMLKGKPVEVQTTIKIRFHM
jgi:protein TonB